MGSDKALLSYEGMDFVSRAVYTLQRLALPVRVVTDAPERFLSPIGTDSYRSDPEWRSTGGTGNGSGRLGLTAQLLSSL